MVGSSDWSVCGDGARLGRIGGLEVDLRSGFRNRRSPVVDPSSATLNYGVQPHLPKREGQGVTFPVSLQNLDLRAFTPRPALVWEAESGEVRRWSYAELDAATLAAIDEIFPGPGGRAPEAYAW